MTSSKIFNNVTKNIQKMGDKIIEKEGLLHNRILLYSTFVLSLLNLVFFVVDKDFTSITFFILIGFLTSFFSKNMMVVLLLSLILTNILKYGSTLNKEETDEDEELEGMEDELEGMEDELEGMEDELEGMEDELEGMEDELEGLDEDEKMEGMKYYEKFEGIGAAVAANYNLNNRVTNLENEKRKREREEAQRRKKRIEEQKKANNTKDDLNNLKKNTINLIKDENALLMNIDKMNSRITTLTDSNNRQILNAPNYA